MNRVAPVVAGGDENCEDIEELCLKGDLFGHVISDSTVHRTFHELDGDATAELPNDSASVRVNVWDRLALTSGTGADYLDFDDPLI